MERCCCGYAAVILAARGIGAMVEKRALTRGVVMQWKLSTESRGRQRSNAAPGDAAPEACSPRRHGVDGADGVDGRRRVSVTVVMSEVRYVSVKEFGLDRARVGEALHPNGEDAAVPVS